MIKKTERWLVLFVGVLLLVPGAALSEELDAPVAPTPPHAPAGPVPPTLEVPGVNPVSPSDDSLERAQRHMEEAFKALGEAGRSAYEEQAPQVRERVQKLLDKALDKLDQLEKRIAPQQEPPSSPRSDEPYYL